VSCVSCRLAQLLHGAGLHEQVARVGPLDNVEANADAVRLLCDLRPDYIKLERRLPHRMEQQRVAAAVRNWWRWRSAWVCG
jgi:EAL domain-containing protein (putative c-di-GMP-specific phosphodiesterase class I)